MKKIIMAVLLFLSFNTSVQALDYSTYYSEYGDYSDYVAEKLNDDDLTSVETETRYKWYKTTKEGDYVRSDVGKDNYQYVDYNKYYYTDYSDWTKDIIDFSDDKLVETREVYNCKKIKPINRLLIQEFDTKGGSAKIDNIKIYYKGHEIEYDLMYLDRKINIDVSESIFLYIDLGNNYYLSDLSFEIVSTDFKNINSFSIYALHTTEVDYISDIYYAYKFSGSNDSVLRISYNDFASRNPSYEEEETFYNLDDIKDYDVVEILTEYRYKDKLYYFYNIRRDYIDGYYKDLDGYLRDDSDYKLYYRYRNRNKLEVANEIIIDNYSKKLDDFVFANVDYEISTNINYYKNGKYYVKYITDFIEVEREVTVDIMENDIRESFNHLVEQYNGLKNEYSGLDRDYNNLLSDYNMKLKEIELLNNNLVLYSNKLSNLEKINSAANVNLEGNYLNEKKVLEEEKDACMLNLDDMRLRNEDNEKKLKLSDQVNQYLENSLLDISKENRIENVSLVSFIIFGLLILILVIIIIKKKLRKNKF